MDPIPLPLPGPLLDVRLGGCVNAEAVRGAIRACRPAAADIEERIRRELELRAEARRKQVEQALAALQQAADDVAALRERILAEAHEQLAELALQIARKVLMQEIEDGRARVEPIVRRALEGLPNHQEITVHLHPDDWAQCDLAQQMAQQTPAPRVQFAADPQLGRCECRIETREGMIESRMQANLSAVTEALSDGRGT